MGLTTADKKALKEICDKLEALRAEAERDGWTSLLDGALRDLRNGGADPNETLELIDSFRRADGTGRAADPALDSLRDLNVGHPRPPGSRSEFYRCSSGCGVTAYRDEKGHPPTCINGAPMLSQEA